MAGDDIELDLELALADSIKDVDLEELASDTGFEDVQGEMLKERVLQLARLRPDTSKEELVDLLDATFTTANGLLRDYAAFRDIPDDMIKDVGFFMQILEQCIKFQDREFKMYAQKKAMGLQKTMEFALKRRKFDHKPPEPPKIKLPSDVKLDPESVEIFTKAYGRHVWQRLAPLHIIDPDNDQTLPFFLSPVFGERFTQGIYKHIIPWMLGKKAIQALVASLPRPSEAEEYLRSKFNHEGANPSKNYWELGFKSIAGSGKEKRSAFNEFWDFLCEEPAGGEYLPPKPADYLLFRDIFNFEISKIRSGVVGIQQVLEQESHAGGREGSSRDYLCKLARDLHFHTGDLIAVWAAYTYPVEMSEEIKQGFIKSMGRTRSERRVYAPYFMDYVLGQFTD
ncbi:MAG: hypothetical protein OQK35_07050 [Alphaproteobacteria bacterium]|nr:hypothetical protein [Rhodospirillales bacterium]MCW9046076.1 hypothetical protein [Alphaproteobacteria bacterium]